MCDDRCKSSMKLADGNDIAEIMELGINGANWYHIYSIVLISRGKTWRLRQKLADGKKDEN